MKIKKPYCSFKKHIHKYFFWDNITNYLPMHLSEYSNVEITDIKRKVKKRYPKEYERYLQQKLIKENNENGIPTKINKKQNGK